MTGTDGPLTTHIHRLAIELRLSAPARFHFYHGLVLHGLLCRALGKHDLPRGIVPYACESGSVDFAPGARYRFLLTTFGEESRLLPALLHGLANLGEKWPLAGPRPTLGGNYSIEAVRELPSPVLSPARAETGKSQSQGPLTLRLLSPLRMARPATLRATGKKYLDGDCFPLAYFLERLYRRLLALGVFAEDSRERNRALADAAATARLREASLLWVDVEQKGVPYVNHERPGGYTLGGVVGHIVVEDLGQAWLPLLDIGHHTHVGENTHAGLGRYLVERMGHAKEARDLLRPATTVLERATEPALLGAALDRIARNSEAPGVDGVRPEELQLAGPVPLAALSEELRAGSYKPQPLLGVRLEKPAGGFRALGIPTATDRAAQRAAADALAASIDALLEDCSYAYRKGFSRSGAARAISAAWRQGFRYVVDADVDAFFDTVDWQRLLAKLRALFPFEPLVDVIDAWLRVPVVFDGRTLARERGLPQGAPISPLLANLFLDEFDEELLGQDYRLVRYADDFVVLCKDLAAAQKARDAARAALAELGLELHTEKTSIQSLADGFSYLGYLFQRDRFIESPKAARHSPPASAGIPPTLETAMRKAWLARAPFTQVGELELDLEPERAAKPARKTSAKVRARPEASTPRPRFAPDRPDLAHAAEDDQDAGGAHGPEDADDAENAEWEHGADDSAYPDTDDASPFDEHEQPRLDTRDTETGTTTGVQSHSQALGGQDAPALVGGENGPVPVEVPVPVPVPVEGGGRTVASGSETRRVGRFVPLRVTLDEDAKGPLYVTGTEARLFLRSDTLIIEPGGDASERGGSRGSGSGSTFAAGEARSRAIPIRGIEQLVLIGNRRASVPLLLRLARFGIPVYFCSHAGKLEGVFAPHAPSWSNWAAQARALENPELRVGLARRIVAAKLHNFAAIAVRFGLQGARAIAASLRDLQRAASAGSEATPGDQALADQALAELRGYEGRGAALYFGAMRASLPPEWGFQGRVAHPPPDPVNAMLSFAYTMLHNHISTALHGAGLNPTLGFFHVPRGAFNALAADIQEEFRYLADALVWSVINRREITVSDFVSDPTGRYPCLLEHTARRRFLREFERRLQLEFQIEPGRVITYRGFMDSQARAIRELVHGRRSEYNPLRAHS